MKAKEYTVLCEAIERGVSYGYMRAYKHNDNPSNEDVKIAIQNAVLTEICEWFDFEE